MADELAFLTIAEAARLIEQKRLSPVELTTELIRRTEALDPQLNAYLLLTADRRPCGRPGSPSRARDHGGPPSRPHAPHPLRGEGHLFHPPDPHPRAFEGIPPHRPPPPP